MSGGYTKLFSDIITSTIWQEPNDCRVLWITILALKDEGNICRATVPALAKLCNISPEQCEAYLEQFQSPDKYSRSQDFDGRRIEQVDGGWFVLNGQKYKDMLRGQERRDYIRVKVAEHRERVNKSKQSKQSKPIAEAEAEAVSSKQEETKSKEFVSRKRATALPKPFALTPEWVETAQRLGMVNGSTVAVFENFCDYWWGCGKAKVDWLAVWRTWIRKDLKSGGGTNGSGEKRRRSLAEASEDDERRGDRFYGPLGNN